MNRNRVYALIISWIICLGLAVPLPLAANIDTSIKIYDEAGLLNASGIADLSALAREIAERQQMDLVFVTVSGTGSKSAMEYADDFYDYNGFGYGEEASGLLLLIDIGQRILWISTTGEAIDLFTDSDIDDLMDAITAKASAGDFYSVGRIFLNQADQHISAARLAALPLHERYGIMQRLVASLLIGFSISALVVLVMVKRHRRSLALPPAAYTYLQNGVEHFTRQEDVFLHTHTRKAPIPQNKPRGGGTSTHRGSSGRTHGGGGRRF